MKKGLQVYELVTYLKNANLTESKLKTIIEKYKDFLIGKGSQVMIKYNKNLFDDPVKNRDAATYIQIFYVSDGSLM